jgi:hypothetical protein
VLCTPPSSSHFYSSFVASFFSHFLFFTLLLIFNPFNVDEKIPERSDSKRSEFGKKGLRE